MNNKIDKKCYQCTFFKASKKYYCSKKKQELINPFEKYCEDWKYWFDDRVKKDVK